MQLGTRKDWIRSFLRIRFSRSICSEIARLCPHKGICDAYKEILEACAAPCLPIPAGIFRISACIQPPQACMLFSTNRRKSSCDRRRCRSNIFTFNS